MVETWSLMRDTWVPNPGKKLLMAALTEKYKLTTCRGHEFRHCRIKDAICNCPSTNMHIVNIEWKGELLTFEFQQVVSYYT